VKCWATLFFASAAGSEKRICEETGHCENHEWKRPPLVDGTPMMLSILLFEMMYVRT